MNSSSSFSARKLASLLLAVVLLTASAATRAAQAALLNVSLSNTSQLPQNTGFFLQYINVNGVADGNTVTASNFMGLTPNGAPDTSVGTASGDLSGTPSNPSVGDAGNALSNEFFQGFNATANTISFSINTTTNAVSSGSPFDSLSFQLIRQDGNAYTTNAPDGQSLFTLTFDNLNSPTINAGGTGNYSTTDPSLGSPITATVTAAPVPEPSTWAMMALGVGALGLIVRRKRGETQHSTYCGGVAI